jgi:hypothetical protein
MTLPLDNAGREIRPVVIADRDNVLAYDSGGWRRYLGGESLHCGSAVEVFVGSRWVGARYEARLWAMPHPDQLELGDLVDRATGTEFLYFGADVRVIIDPTRTRLRRPRGSR